MFQLACAVHAVVTKDHVREHVTAVTCCDMSQPRSIKRQRSQVLRIATTTTPTAWPFIESLASAVRAPQYTVCLLPVRARCSRIILLAFLVSVRPRH